MLHETQDQPRAVAAPAPVTHDEPARIAAAWWAVGLVALTCVTFGSIIRHEFVNFDDTVIIVENPAMNPPTLRAVLEYAKGPYYGGAWPMTYALFAALTALARDEAGVIHPALFHATSLALHVGAVLIVFALLRSLIKQDAPPALGAALFAMHPLQVESVAWITNLNTLLYGFFSLLALLLYVRYAQRIARDDRRRGTRWLYAAATVAFVVAMTAKPLAVTLPVMAAAIDLVFVRRRLRDVAWPVGFWLLLALPIMVATRVMLEPPEIYIPPLLARPLVALDALAFYVAKFFAPIGLSPDYSRSPEWLMKSRAVYVTWLMPAAIAVILWRARRGAPQLVAAAAIFVAGMLPVLGLTPFHTQEFSTVADRYAYVSMLGVAIVAAWALARWPRPAVYALAVVWLAALATWSHIESRRWRDTETLWRATLARNPGSIAGNNGLGFLETRRGDAAAAAGKPDVAAEHYRIAETYYETSRRTDPRHATTLYNLGNLYRARGRRDLAIPLYGAALERAPHNRKIHNNLGVALAEVGQLHEADRWFRRALERDPDYVDALIGRGVVNRELGRFDVSLRAYEQALEVDPDSRLAQQGLAKTRAKMAEAQHAR